MNNKKKIYFLKQTINYGIKNSNVLRSQPALSENPRVQVKTLKNSNKVVQIQNFSYLWPQIRKINKIKQSNHSGKCNYITIINYYNRKINPNSMSFQPVFDHFNN